MWMNLLASLMVVMSCGLTADSSDDDLPAAAVEILTQFQTEIEEIARNGELELLELRHGTAASLKPVQDDYCREALLDQALAVRELIRALQAGADHEPTTALPREAWEIYVRHEDEAEQRERRQRAAIDERRGHALAALRRVRDPLLQAARLRDAVAVRQVMQSLREDVTEIAPDPGHVSANTTDIGKVYFFEVVGTTSGGSLYGTGIYTNGSHLGMAAVHSGVLKAGQRGVVKVTIMPGRSQYVASTLHGITSYAYGAYSVSFKVERVYGYARRAG